MDKFNATACAALAFISLLSYYLIRRQRSPRTQRSPPEAGGAWPFLGHLNIIIGRTGLPHVNLGNLANKHGPIFEREGRQTPGLRLRHARVFLLRRVLAPDTQAGLARALLGAPSRAAAQRKRLGDGTLRRRALRGVGGKEGRVGPGCGGDEGGVRGAEHERDTEDGGRFGGEAEEARRCRRVMREFFHMAGFFVPSDAFPYLERLDLGGHERRMKRTADEMDELVGEWLEEHRRKEYSGEEKAQDFMDVMLSAVKGGNYECEYDVDTIIKATCGVCFSSF